MFTLGVTSGHLRYTQVTLRACISIHLFIYLDTYDQFASVCSEWYLDVVSQGCRRLVLTFLGFSDRLFLKPFILKYVKILKVQGMTF